MDTTKGELSFVVDGANLGVAYDGIPLDKPLVPCDILRSEGSFVELIIHFTDYFLKIKIFSAIFIWKFHF